MMTKGKTIIMDNYRDYSQHICNIEIPKFGNKKTLIEIRRSLITDAAFIIVEDDKPKVVDQIDISDEIKRISLGLFTAFGTRGTQIMWAEELDTYFCERVRKTSIESLQSMKDDDSLDNSFGSLFG